ncbi:hypothetical protein JKF63_07090 [Porcisia hertigi]|uniref:PH-like domain-containing protein n=1 Tax=Porcisia hertigi TaxID=2761500 RepID=A0A836LKB4_9TRYP|nr:hypothetical protein JKF63_07090 [Porcisia hertigi]
MAPRNGPRVKVISPNSETIDMSRSVSVASSVYSSGHLTPGAVSLLRSGPRRGGQQRGDNGMTHGDHPAAMDVAPQTKCGVLRTMGVNVLHETSSYHDKGALYGHTLSSAQVPAGTTTTAAAAASGCSGKGVRSAPTRRSLPNFFEEADLSNGGGTEKRQRPPQTGTSRSHSRSYPATTPALGQRQQSLSRRRAEDEDAIRRATAAFERAGCAVLRRPFRGGSVVTTTTTTTTGSRTADSVLGANTSSLPVQQEQQQPERPGLCLPPTIPITAHKRRHRSEDGDYSDKNSSLGSTTSSYKRGRSWAEPPSRMQAPSQQPTPASQSAFYRAPSMGENAEKRTAVPRVCPGMFTGLSAIPVDEKLFVNANESHTNHTPKSLAASTAGLANTVVAAGGGAQQHRYCVRPLWSLVGTFKTSLSGLVTIDFNKECLRWSQRNPKGGHQTINVPLASMLDVFTTKVVQEDEHIEERQFTVVARTSTRPSQVVFGFSTVSEANHMRNILKRR